MNLVPLRDYQTETIHALHSSWDAGRRLVPAVLATGLGKTVIFAALITKWLAEHPGQRALVIAHRDELISQAVRKLRDASPNLPIGIVKATRNEVYARVVVASIQSLARESRRDQLRRIGLIVIDECHHSTAPTYRRLLDHFPDAQVAGFTATFARGDKSKLSEVWGTEEPAVTFGIGYGIRRGYLLDVRGKRVEIPDFDLSEVKKLGGDYESSSLADAMEAAFAPETIAKAYVEHASDRKGLVFWPLVSIAEHGARAFNQAGIPSALVHAGTPTEERRLILKRLAQGDIQCVHNCGVLTEGFDDPTISAVVVARPTRSAPLYQQMVGRGLRPNLSLPPESRGDCLVLDVSGASRNHDLRCLVDLSEKRIPVELLDDELSLLEMEEWEDREERNARDHIPEPQEVYKGETEVADFDPLGRTTVGAWLTTFGGTYFLPVGRRAYVLILPSQEEPGHWDVGWLTKDPKDYGYLSCPAKGYSKRFGRHRLCVERRYGNNHEPHEGSHGDLTEHRGLSLSMACSWAEEVMESLAGRGIAARVGRADAAWRNEPPSWTLLQKAYELHIPTKGLTKGELSDAVEILTASARIDPIVAFMASASVTTPKD